MSAGEEGGPALSRTRSPQGAAVLDRNDPLPLWRQLHDDLLARVERGDFPERFPGEIELTESYGVSRHTVREALRRLRRDGLVESSRGRASVAHPDVISQHLGAMHSLVHELESRGIEQRSELLVAEERTDPQAAQRLGLAVSAVLVHVERIRHADGDPIAWDRVWVHPDVGRAMLEVDLTCPALYDEWRRASGLGPTAGHETIRAVSPPARVRARLRMDHGEAALEVERVGYAGDRPVEVGTTVIRGSRFAFTAEWSAAGAYQVELTGYPAHD
jgi:GntR family transcriptional regulator